MSRRRQEKKGQASVRNQLGDPEPASSRPTATKQPTTTKEEKIIVSWEEWDWPALQRQVAFHKMKFTSQGASEPPARQDKCQRFCQSYTNGDMARWHKLYQWYPGCTQQSVPSYSGEKSSAMIDDRIQRKQTGIQKFRRGQHWAKSWVDQAW